MHLPPLLVLRTDARILVQDPKPPQDSSTGGPVPRGETPATQGVPTQQPSGSPCGLDGMTLWPMLAMFAALWFLVLRPQQKQEKLRKEQVMKADRGDRIVTSGGIWGVIVNGDKDTVTIRIDADVKLKLDRAAIGRVVKDDAGAKGDAPAKKT